MSSMLINIDSEDEQDGATNDSIKYKKDCPDFKCLNDGTITGEYRYCNLSLMCRQVGVMENGQVVPMEACYLPVADETGQVMSQELFCTGMYDLRPLKERYEDDKVS